MGTTWNWAGAKWWKFDFHTHTPASNDYGKGPDQVQLKLMTPRDWLLSFMRQEIDCLAVTDHNSGAWIELLKTEVETLKSESLPEFRPLYIFPGVELTVQGNIHILAVFSPEKNSDDINSLLGAVRYRATKGESDGCSECSPLEVIEEIHRLGGIAIPAHVDQGSGLFSLTGNTLIQPLECKYVFAMEVIDPNKSKPQSYIDKKLKWSEILGSDSHHPCGDSDNRYPGSHFTWVKMAMPSLDGLRLALIDGELSLKRSDTIRYNPNRHGQLVLTNIEIKDAKYIGRGTPFSCHLNPWLNSIIGGRGTGKSTVVEFLRLTSQRQDEIPRTLSNEFGKYQKISGSRLDDGLLTNSSVIKIEFYKDRAYFRVSWRSNGNNYKIEEKNTSGDWVDSPCDILQRFPIRIYSQKQIFELAKEPQALLKVINDAPDVNYRELKREFDEMVTKFLSFRAQEREVAAGLQEESTLIGQLEDIKRKLQLFENAENANIFTNYQHRQNQLKILESWHNSWVNFGTFLRASAGNMIPPELTTQYFDTSFPEDKEILEKSSQIILTFRELQQQILKISELMEATSIQWNNEKTNLKLFKTISNATNDYNRLLTQLTEIGVDDPSTYGNLVKQRQNIEEKIKNLDIQKKKLAELKENSQKCYNDIHILRRKITESRSNFLTTTLDNNPYVKINVIPYGNLSACGDEIRDLIGKSGTGFDRDIGIIGEDEGLLSLLSPTPNKPIEKCIDELKHVIFNIHINNPDAINSLKDKRFGTYIQTLKPEQIDRIFCWFPEDSLDVQYSLKDCISFKPIEQGSPGQKTAALLAFILSYGDDPLILDQPEDDLDNYLIYDLIVTQLREIKQKRQVIVVTHNANIVVNGDSENVIALDIRRGQTQIVAQGCLQESSIRDEICRVMEGGKEAFDLRYKRINVGR